MTELELGWIQGDLDKAIKTFEGEKAKLYRQDGTPRYTPAEHRERLAELLAPVEHQAERARAAAKEALEQSDNEDTLSDFDPLLKLAGKQQDMVMVKQAIIGPTVESMELPALARRLTSIMHHGDEIDKRLHAFYTQKRVDEMKSKMLREARRNARGGDAGSGVKVAPPDGFGEVAEALRKLNETLVDPDIKLKLATAKARRERAHALTRYVTDRVNDITGVVEQRKREFAERVRRMA